MGRLDALSNLDFAMGAFQLVANLAILARDPRRIRAEHANGEFPERFADLLSVSWIYGGASNLLVSLLLILMVRPLREGNPVAGTVVASIGSYYVLVGLATYSFGLRRHRGLLVFTLLGIALLGGLLPARGIPLR